MTPPVHKDRGSLFFFVNYKKVYFLLVTKVRKCYFLVPNKKVTKEVGWGEALMRSLSMLPQ